MKTVPKNRAKQRHTQTLFLCGDMKVIWNYCLLLYFQKVHILHGERAKSSLASLPILPERYEFQVTKGKSKQFAIVKS
jgi:hypothetical protein